MRFTVDSKISDAVQAIIVGVFDSGLVDEVRSVLPNGMERLINRLVREGVVSTKLGLVDSTYFEDFGRVLIVGLGDRNSWNKREFKKAVGAAARVSLGIESVASTLTLIQMPGNCVGWRIIQSVIAFQSADYQFEDFKRNKADSNRLGTVNLTVIPEAMEEAGLNLSRGKAIADAMDLARNLGNTPPNVCTPNYLVQKARDIAQKTASKIEILGCDKISEIGMNSFLAVAKGSAEEPQFIILKYEGGADGPYVLVGKGITFDSGGISLKPGESMDEMKFDMMGAASVMATFQGVAQLKLPINLICVVAACENMPAGNANKPGDIITTLNGLTVEVLNTDAEGRMILADALSYVERFNPKYVIDVATLTGACIIALGHCKSALFSNDEELAEKLLAAGMNALDEAWRMPLDDEYFEQIKGQYGDLRNTGGRAGGTITAALFLAQFAKKYRWAHLDIASTAWEKGKSATGRPVPMLMEYFLKLDPKLRESGNVHECPPLGIAPSGASME